LDSAHTNRYADSRGWCCLQRWRHDRMVWISWGVSSHRVHLDWLLTALGPGNDSRTAGRRSRSNSPAVRQSLSHHLGDKKNYNLQSSLQREGTNDWV